MDILCSVHDIDDNRGFGMSNYNWCHGPKCHEHRTQDRIRGVKGNKVLRTRKVSFNPNASWYDSNSSMNYFCSQGCQNDFWNIYGNQIRQIAPRTEPLETSIEVEVKTYTNWRGELYKQKVIKEVDNQDQVGVG